MRVCAYMVGLSTVVMIQAQYWAAGYVNATGNMRQLWGCYYLLQYAYYGIHASIQDRSTYIGASPELSARVYADYGSKHKG